MTQGFAPRRHGVQMKGWGQAEDGDQEAVLASPAFSSSLHLSPGHLQERDSFQVLSRTALITQNDGDSFAVLGQFLAPGTLGSRCMWPAGKGGSALVSPVGRESGCTCECAHRVSCTLKQSTAQGRAGVCVLRGQLGTERVHWQAGASPEPLILVPPG